MLFVLALVPVVGLLFFIYFNDKKEKEPIGLLVALFFAGMGTVLTAMAAEILGQLILGAVMPDSSVVKAVLLAIVIVGPAEELGKYFVLRIISWKNKNFDYSFDAIVYAVFVSLGFACLENINYVFSNGAGTAFLRMMTAVPGHACYAVFMGYFYGKSKYALLTGNKGRYAGFTLLSIFVPIVTHGVYDAILMAGYASGVDTLAGLSLILWILYIIALFTVSCIFIVRSSNNDFCIITLPDKVQTVYKPSVVGSWTCSCGSENFYNYCSKCGRVRTFGTLWHCPNCRTLCTMNFCGNCGCSKPSSEVKSI